MKVPVSWLREYVALEMPLDELATRLSITSAEVEGIERVGVADEDGNLDLFKVGKVLAAEKHPDADRLQLCQVDVGRGDALQIVCGAWNFGPGATVGVALPGAVLPSGLELGVRDVRGQASHGMILAEDEVALGTDHTGIMLLPEAEPGTPLADVLPLADRVLTVEATGNRPDLLSVYGLAREVAAIYDLELAPWPGAEPPRTGDETVTVEIEDFGGCPRYLGRLFRGVSIEPSPVWLKARLLAAGMRPISNIVDVTNYVMLALGSPLHAFDWKTVGTERIMVRRARPGESMRTLDGAERRLDPADLLITDGERPIALAAIMGGEETEIGDSTTEVLLEAANFEPHGIFRTSERLRLRTEGSNRWEKGVDPHLAEHAARLATELIVQLSNAEWVGESDVHAGLPERQVVRFRPERADAVIGIETAAEEQQRILARLGFEQDNGSVAAPTWRGRDVTREIDVVEEIARFRLDDVPFTLPRRRAMFGTLTRSQALRRRVEEALVGLGFSETYTPSLVPPGGDGSWVLPEPISVELTTLRTSLLPSLVEAARRNVDLGAERIALFEIARVYLDGGELPDERLRVAGIVAGGFARAKGSLEVVYDALKSTPDFARAEDPLFHPGKTARTEAGLVGEIHPAVLEGGWGAFELDLRQLFAGSGEPVTYEDVVTFPLARQDIAVAVAEDIEAGALVATARQAGGAELREARVFDVYRGEQVEQGRKSVAIRLAFQLPDRTLSDEDVTGLRERIVEALAREHDAQLRS
ncbi:MAG TPA: phenylalanine--tRNA ligase subunit beta [Gaiellaceae bacterium]|nr:phenylalanine--tRNA ligase subunit beta [Gaiellaceae bacterium]